MEGEEDIWKQLLKLSEDTERVPEHVVFDVLVVTEVVSIDSDTVTETLSVIETPPWLSAGVIDETVGAIVSITIDLFVPREPVAPGEGSVKVASLVALSRMLPLFKDRESVAL